MVGLGMMIVWIMEATYLFYSIHLSIYPSIDFTLPSDIKVSIYLSIYLSFITQSNATQEGKTSQEKDQKKKRLAVHECIIRPTPNITHIYKQTYVSDLPLQNLPLNNRLARPLGLNLLPF